MMMRGLDHRSERNDGILGRDHRSGGRVETVTDRQHAQAEAVLGLEDRRAGSIELRARRLGEGEQRSVGMRGEGPDDPHFVTGRRRELGAHTLRQRVTADD
jgi:hypothetical protein